MIIICSKNIENRIQIILESIEKYKVLLVDCSTDKTRKIAKKFKNVTIIKDQGKGLASARNLALKYLQKKKLKWILFLGDDNVINPEEIDKAIEFMATNNFCGVGFKTITTSITYLQKAINYRWEKKFKVGKNNVIGTPSLWNWNIIKNYRFDENCQDADDADLCERLRKDENFLGYSPFICLDLTIENFKTIKDRFLRYGKSDAEYYKKYSNIWNWKRKIKSLLHPIITEKELLFSCYFPVYFLLIIFRYIGYIKWLL